MCWHLPRLRESGREGGGQEVCSRGSRWPGVVCLVPGSQREPPSGRPCAVFGYLARRERLNCPPRRRSIYLTPGDTGSRSCQFCGFTSASGHLGTQNTQAWWALQAEPVAVPRAGASPTARSAPERLQPAGPQWHRAEQPSSRGPSPATELVTRGSYEPERPC